MRKSVSEFLNLTVPRDEFFERSSRDMLVREQGET